MEFEFSSDGDMLINGWTTIKTGTNVYHPIPKINNVKIINANIGGDNMYKLYSVIVVDRKGFVWLDQKVVAKTVDGAKFKAGANGYDPDENNIIVKEIANVEIEEDDKDTNKN